MNRTFALLLALLILLAHMLAIHKDGADAFAPPYEIVHVAYRLARNFVHHGQWVWDPGHRNVESYPSLLWIGVCTVPERLYWQVTVFSQICSVSAAVATAWVVARFSPKRLAGVIAPLFFVASGSIAAAAASGTEMTSAALFIAGAFLAYERGARVWLAILLSMVCLTRPEGFLFVCAMAAVELSRRIWPSHRSERADEPNVLDDRPRPALWQAFVVPALAALTVCSVRFSLTGHWLSPWSKLLTHPDRVPWGDALRYLRDFFVSSGSGLLLAFPLWYLVRGSLSGVGVRALALTLAWCAISTLGGGGPQALPFSQFMVPILGVLFVAVQEAMTHALDSRRRFLPPLTWALFGLGLASSSLASKYPGDLGPLHTEPLYEAWMTPHTEPRFDYIDMLGRMGLEEQIAKDERLRDMGAFLRDHLDPAHSVLTPWPGAIGYLSRLRVIDALSRVTPIPGMLRAHGWSALERTDVIAALEERPDYIVPTLGGGRNAPTVQEIVLSWIEGLDYAPLDESRRARIFQLLSEYELITTPAAGIDGRVPKGGDRYYFLRRRDLDLAPDLSMDLEGDEFVVRVTHRAHEQLVDLRVQLERVDGTIMSLDPTGAFCEDPHLTARRAVLLFPSGSRAFELVRARIPKELDGVRLLARLRNPGARGESGADVAGREVVAELR